MEMTDAMRRGLHRPAPEQCWCTGGKVSPRCKIHSQHPIAAPGAAASGPVASNLTESPNDHNSDRPVPNSQPQCDQAPALGGAVQGKEAGVYRVTVRFTGYRVRPLDPDNFAGSVKDLLDGLRHAGLIVGDEPWRIILETEQVKVASFKEEKTVIEITTA